MLLIVLNISNGAKQPSCTKRGLLLLILNLPSNVWIFPLKISFKYAWLSFGSTCCGIFDSVQKFFHTGLYWPGDIMSSFGETSTIIWSRETIGVWKIQMKGAKGVNWTNIKWMNETKVEEILNQYQSKHIYCTDRSCWALNLAQNLPSQIIPEQTSL